jgi:hypothetical protein
VSNNGFLRRLRFSQEALSRVLRLSTTGAFAVAYEINQPLRAIRSRLAFGSRRLEQAPFHHAANRILIDAAARWPAKRTLMATPLGTFVGFAAGKDNCPWDVFIRARVFTEKTRSVD